MREGFYTLVALHFLGEALAEVGATSSGKRFLVWAREVGIPFLGESLWWKETGTRCNTLSQDHMTR